MTYLKTYKNITENQLFDIATDLLHGMPFPSTFCFYGDLGAGKTALCRTIIRVLMGDNNFVVPSPTFTLMQEYECEKEKVAHFDFYRLQDPLEVIELNLDGYLQTHLCLIEWPQNVQNFLPEKYTKIELLKKGELMRDIRILK